MGKRRGSIRTKILAAVLLLGIIPLSAAAGSLWVGWRVLTRDAYKQVAQLPVGAATRIEELLYFRYVDSIQFASSPTITQAADRTAQDQLLSRLKGLYQPYTWLGLVAADGTVQAASDSTTPGLRVLKPYWADAGRRTADGVLVTDVHASSFYGGLPVVGFSTPVEAAAPGRAQPTAASPAAQSAAAQSAAAAPQRYVYAEVSMAFVSRHVADVDPGQGGQVLLVDSQGRIIADRQGPRLPGDSRKVWYGNAALSQNRQVAGPEIRSLQAFQMAREGLSGAVRERVTGRDTIVGYTPLKGFGPYPGLGWSLLVLVPTRQAFASVISEAWFTGLILLFGLLLAVAVSIYLSNRFTVPLLRLAAVTGRAQAGELADDFPPAATGDEIEQLTEGFRSMVRSIAQKQRELEEAHQLQSEFLTNITHESRTPLTAILAVSEVLEQEVAGPVTDRQSQYIRSIAANAQKVMEWINNLLDLARAEAGRIELKRQPVDLPEVARSVRDTVEGLARARDIAYAEGWPERLPAAWADPDRLRQVMLNLLGNAVKFTPPGGRVTLEGFQQSPGWVGFAVRDTGIGIAPEDLERIFEKFQQADSSSSRRYPGSGLGLALVRHLVELHGGTVSVNSEPNRGATFRVLLPEVRGNTDPPGEFHREGEEDAKDSPGR
ncbi:MAG: ATP-binding protein [Symbiobacteriia bacterium]